MVALLRKIITMPPKVLLQKAAGRIRRHFEEAKLLTQVYLSGFTLSDNEFHRFFKDEKTERILDLLNTRVEQMFPPSVHLKSSDTIDPERLLQRSFDLLGSGDIRFPKDIDWHRDFKSNYRWSPGTFCRNIQKKLPPAPGVDVKVPWELSRLQHFPSLGKAYERYKEPKYAEEFSHQISHWIDSNPVYRGVNWACTMDVAIRAANMIMGYYYFRNAPELTLDFKKSFTKSLVEHGRFIRNNLEWHESARGNHYLSDIVGLAFLGTLFFTTSEGREWADFAFSELVKEIDFQIYPDGVDHEVSISYHRLVVELFCWGTRVLTTGAGFEFPAGYKEKLKKMFGFIRAYTRTDGSTPQIGDADDGRLIILDNYHNWNRCAHSHLFEEFPEYSQLNGNNPKENPEVKLKETSRNSSKAFLHGGFYIMRHLDNHMVIRCGPIGLNGHGGHSHCDQLSFELFAHGIPILIDPGAYIYTPWPDWRNTFRSTAYHNTLRIQGEEQNRIGESPLFSYVDDTQAKCLCWETTEREDVFRGEHSGYQRLPGRYLHRRSVRFDKTDISWEITDEVEGDSPASLEWFFIVHPDGEVQIEKSSFLIRFDSLSFRCTPEGPELPERRFHTEKIFYSPSYGVKVPTTRVRFETTTELPLKLIWKLEKER